MRIVALLAFLCCISPAVMAGATLFDYYALVLVWPASYCYQTSQGCCLPKSGKPELDFLINGLATYKYNTTTSDVVTGCSDTFFDISEISDLEELYGHWSNVKCPSRDPRDDWNSTWTSFGGCSSLSQHDYFKKALQLQRQIDMLSILKKNGIVPSGENFYNVEYIKKVIKRSLGVSVAIECSKNMWEECQLQQIYICLDHDASTIISCPKSLTFACDPEVTFGLFTYDMLNAATPTLRNIRMYSG